MFQGILNVSFKRAAQVSFQLHCLWHKRNSIL